MPDPIKSLFEATKSKGLFLDEADLKSQITKDPNGVFKVVSDSKLFLDFDDFQNTLGLKKKEPAPFIGPSSTQSFVNLPWNTSIKEPVISQSESLSQLPSVKSKSFERIESFSADTNDFFKAYQEDPKKFSDWAATTFPGVSYDEIKKSKGDADKKFVDDAFIFRVSKAYEDTKNDAILNQSRQQRKAIAGTLEANLAELSAITGKQISVPKTIQEAEQIMQELKPKTTPLGAKVAAVEEFNKQVENISGNMGSALNATIGSLVFRDMSAKNPNVTPLEIGREVVRITNPELFKQYEAAGGSKSYGGFGAKRETPVYADDINRQMAQIGGQVMMMYGNKTAIERAGLEEKVLQNKFTYGEQERVKNKIASALYNKGIKPTSASKEQIDQVVESLPDEDKNFWNRAKEDNNIKLPSTGFGYSFKNGYSGVITDAVKTILTPLIPNKTREQALENLKSMSSSDIVGENPKEVAEFEALNQKKADGIITEQESLRLEDLKGRVRVRTGLEKILDFAGGGTGQIVGLGTISAFTGGLSQARTALGALKAIAFPSGGTGGISSAAYLMANESNQKDAIRLFPDNDVKQAIAATAFNAIDMLVERIFPEEQVLTRTIKNDIVSQLSKISKKNINEQLVDNMVKEAARKIVTSGKEVLKAPLQETAEEEIAMVLKEAIIEPILSPEFDKEGITTKKILETGEQAFWGASLLGIPKGLMSLKNTRVPIETIWNTVSSPAEFIKINNTINKMEKSGELSAEDAQEKRSIIAQGIKEYNTNPVVSGEAGDLTLKQRQNYFARLMHEKTLENQMKATTDDNVKADLQNKINESKAQREKIFKKEVLVNEDNREMPADMGENVFEVREKLKTTQGLTDEDFVAEPFTPEEDAADREALPQSDFATEADLETALQSGQFAMLTGMNPSAQQISKDGNKKLNERAKQWLKDKGLNPIEIFGKYGNSERSFFVPDMTREQAIEFAKEFGQESVAHSTGLVYQDGSYSPRTGQVAVAPRFGEENANYFSSMNIGGKPVDFEVGYDTDKRYSPEGKLMQGKPTEVEQRLSDALGDADFESKVASAQKALEKTGISINVIEDPAEYDRIASQSGTQKGTEGIFVSDDGKIYINKEKLEKGITDGLVVWHEASHPVVNIIRNTNKDLFDSVVRGVKELAKTNNDVADALAWAEKEYKDKGQAVVDDESVVEFIARVADGLINLDQVPTGFKQSLIDLINRMAKALGLGQIVDDTDVAAIKKLAADVSNALTTGRDISEVVGAENVKEYINTIESPELVGSGEIKSPNVQASSTRSINVYESKETVSLPKKSLNEIYNQYNGKAVVINSDPTRVGELKLPSGKTIFMYGGPAYLSVKDNVDSNVGFATTQIGKVNTWMKYVNELFGDQPGVTLVASQAPTSMLSNSYALRYVMDGISMLPKSVLRSSDFKNEFFGKDLVALKEAFGEQGYKDFVKKYKGADLSNQDTIDKMISEMAYTVGDNNSPASFKARGTFVSNLLGGLAAKADIKGIEGDKGYASKKPQKYIARQLFERLGINAEKVMYELGEKNLVDLYMNEGNWGYAVAGFETDPNISVESVQGGGVKHPLFNAKFPGKNAFILDGSYDLDNMFSPVEMIGPSGKPYTKTASQMLAGSMYVKGQPLGEKGSFEYKQTEAAAKGIQASKGERKFLRTGPQAMANSIKVGGEDISFVLDYVTSPKNLLRTLTDINPKNEFFSFDREIRRSFASQLRQQLEFWTDTLNKEKAKIIDKEGSVSDYRLSMIAKYQDRVDALSTALEIWENNAFSLKDISVNELTTQASKGGRNLVDEAGLNKEMTSDDQGNYIFYHYSGDKIKSIDPKKFGKNLATGRDERPGVGISMYYTRPDVLEANVPAEFGYVVRVPENKVYPFNEDPLDLLPEAEKQFKKQYPGQAFDFNKQVGFVTKVAEDRGYPMTVAQWNIKGRKVLRAQTTEAMKPELYKQKVYEDGYQVEKTTPELDFKPNAKRRQASVGRRDLDQRLKNFADGERAKGTSDADIERAIKNRFPLIDQDRIDFIMGAPVVAEPTTEEKLETVVQPEGKERTRGMEKRFGDLDEDTVRKIADDAKKYFTQTNKQTEQAAEEFMKDKPVEYMADYVVSNPNIPGAVNVWMAATTAKNLGKEIETAKKAGDADRVEMLSTMRANIYNHFASKATEVGQTIQAFVSFKDDPAANQFIFNKLLKQLEEKGVTAITDAQKTEIKRLLDAVSTAPAGLPKDKAITKLSHYLGKMTPINAFDIIQAIWYAKILSGITTQSKNFFANMMNTFVEVPIVGLRMSVMTGSLQPILYAMKGLGSGTIKGFVKAADILRGGITSKDQDKFFNNDNLLEYFKWSDTKIGKTFGGVTGKILDFPLVFESSPTALKYIGRALTAADALFSTANQEAMANMLAFAQAKSEGKGMIESYARAQEILGNTKKVIGDAKTQAESEGFKPKTAEFKRRVIEIVNLQRGQDIVEKAEDFGKRATLTNEPEGFTRGIYQVATNIQNNLPIARVVIPFTKIVSNISEMLINYSPAGMYRAVTGIKNPKFTFKFSPTGDNKLTPEQRADLFIKSTIAITTLTLLASKTGDEEDDWFDVTAGGPTDFTKKYELMKGGWRPYTITLKDGTKISYADWPFAGVISAIGTIHDADRYGDVETNEWQSKMAIAAYAYMLNFYDKSLVKGISDFVDIFRPEGKYGPDSNISDKAVKFGTQQVKALTMSNLSQQALKLVDEYQDDPIKEAKGAEVLYRDIPILNDGLNPIIDVFGDEVKYATTERILPWMSVSDDKKDQVLAYLNRNNVFVGMAKERPMINFDTMEERKMTRNELYQYRKLAGQYTKELMYENIELLKEINDMEDGQTLMKKTVADFTSSARDRAYAEMIIK